MSKELILQKIKTYMEQGLIKTTEAAEDFYYAYKRSGRDSIQSQITKADRLVVGAILKELFHSSTEYDATKCGSPIENTMQWALTHKNIAFEQQVQIGHYRVDFFIKPNIVIECDGKQFHTQEHDKPRDKYLFSRGYMVRRFSGSEINSNIDTCVCEIQSLIRAAQA